MTKRFFPSILSFFLLVPATHAAAYTANASSGAAEHNDFYSGSSYSWNANSGNVWISSLDCSPCFWSGEKLFFEVPLPAISGNIVSAAFHINVLAGGTGDAWFNVPVVGALTGDVLADQATLQGGFNNSGVRIQQPALGWLSLDATNGVKQQYASSLTYGTFTLDPVPWSTSLVISDMNSGNVPYLTIVTDATAAPEPGTVLLLGLGIAIAGARRFAFR